MVNKRKGSTDRDLICGLEEYSCLWHFTFPLKWKQNILYNIVSIITEENSGIQGISDMQKLYTKY